MRNPLFQQPYQKRVNRGSCWYYVAVHARVSSRDWLNTSDRDDGLGFRVFRTQEEK